MKKLLNLALALAMTMALGACASSDTKSVEQTETTKAEPTTGHPTTGNSLQAKFVAAEQDADASAELKFAAGSSRLPKEANKQLGTAIREARARGRITEVKVIAWGDQEYPSTYKDALPPKQQQLAEARAEAVRKALARRLKNAEVEKISMAERPGAFEDFFKTSDFRIKRSLERAGIPTEDTSVKVPAMEGKTLVLFLTEAKEARGN